MEREELAELVRTVSEDGYHHPHTEVHLHMAIRKIEELLIKGEAMHEPMDWKELEISGNLNKIRNHGPFIHPLTGENQVNASHEDHLLNATCRLLMALQLREERRNGS